MGERKQESEETKDARGCLFLFGIIIVGIGIGHLHSAAAGWLFIGGCLLVAAFL